MYAFYFISSENDFTFIFSIRYYSPANHYYNPHPLRYPTHQKNRFGRCILEQCYYGTVVSECVKAMRVTRRRQISQSMPG